MGKIRKKNKTKRRAAALAAKPASLRSCLRDLNDQASEATKHVKTVMCEGEFGNNSNSTNLNPVMSLNVRGRLKDSLASKDPLQVKEETKRLA